MPSGKLHIGELQSVFAVPHVPLSWNTGEPHLSRACNYGGSRLIGASTMAVMLDGDDEARRKVDGGEHGGPPTGAINANGAFARALEELCREHGTGFDRPRPRA